MMYELGFNKALVVFWGRGKLIHSSLLYLFTLWGGWSLCQPTLGNSAAKVWTASQLQSWHRIIDAQYELTYIKAEEGGVREGISSVEYLSKDTTSETITHLFSQDLWLKGQVQLAVLQTGKRRNCLIWTNKIISHNTWILNRNVASLIFDLKSQGDTWICYN